MISNRSDHDPFGFKFWLIWILAFVLFFVLSAGVWTWLLQAMFGKIEGPQMAYSWALCVFGSWLLIVIPFMRKKEQIWKRLNYDQESAVDLWLRLMAGLVAVWIVETLFWTWRFRTSDTWILWLRAILASYLASFIPFLIFAYQKAEVLFQKASIRQLAKETSFKRQFVARNKRCLPQHFQKRLQSLPETLPGGHVVTVSLKNGRAIPHVFIYKTREVLGLYNVPSFDWSVSDIQEMSVIQPDQLPPYEESKWMRLDG
jgi:glucan phosphoethanolaminetransferase (alkaline phosphatase superfamily)